MKIYSNGKVLEASGGGADLIPGDGVSIQNLEISVSTPVRGILTQEEFDALPEEQRNKGLYVIPDGGTGGGSGGESAGPVYSTEETRIGTWIDGKPIYRIVFTETGIGTSEISRDINVRDLNVDTPIRMHTLSVGLITYQTGFYGSSSSYLNTFFVSPNLRIRSAGMGAGVKTIYTIFEYTKTTDEGGTV